MKPIIISLALLLSSVTLFSQTNLGDEKEISSWLGEWEGELNIEFFAISDQLVPKEALPMRIRHFKTDTIGTYGWFMIYGEDEEIGTRPLYLREKDPLNGHYLIEEQNGVPIDTYLEGNKMISCFEADDALLTSVYTLDADGNIVYELFFSKPGQVNASRGLKSYVMKGYQRAELKRVSKGNK